jgi:hypothetical protein
MPKPLLPYNATGGWAAHVLHHVARRRLLSTPRLLKKPGLPWIICMLASIATLQLWMPKAQYESSSKARAKLILVLPFTGHESEVLVRNVESWSGNMAACSPGLKSHVDLGLFFHATPSQLPSTIVVLTQRLRTTALKECFGQVHTLFANLTPEEDIYPAGPSAMFFRIFNDLNIKKMLRPYRVMYWMELDTFPVKPLWIDKLYAESLIGDFWMKGSIYFGPAFDESVKAAANWDWVGHINGNALYRLHEHEFDAFLKLVEDVEPPAHFWKPFDISIWKVLHTFPYYWRIHQRVVRHFAYSDFVQHWGFTITPDDVEQARIADSVYLVHGKNSSAGTIIYKQKFKDGVPMTHEPVNFDGSIDTRDDVCVMLRSWRDDLPYVVTAIKSIRLNMMNARHIVLVIPDTDHPLFQEQQQMKRIHQDVKLIAEPKLMPNDHIQQKYSKMMADTYCPCSYIFHLDSDVVFMRRIYRKDLFFMGKPLLEYDRYSNLPETTLRWKLGTSNAVGRPVEHEYSRSNNHMYPRSMYPAARRHLERRFGKPFPDFMATRIGKFNETHCFNCDNADPKIVGLAFSDFNYMGAFLWFYMHESMVWQPLDPEESKHVYMRPIIPPFVCQGNARLAHDAGKVSEEIKALERAMRSGDCTEVIKMGVAFTTPELNGSGGDVAKHT